MAADNRNRGSHHLSNAPYGSGSNDHQISMPAPPNYYDNDNQQETASSHDLLEDGSQHNYQRHSWNGSHPYDIRAESGNHQRNRFYSLDNHNQRSSPPSRDGQHLDNPTIRMRQELPSMHDGEMYSPALPVGPMADNSLGRHSQTVECPWCHAVVNTQIKRRIGYKAGGAAVAAAIIAWPLFWVPLVIPGLHRKTHYCPQCHRKIGRGRRNV